MKRKTAPERRHGSLKGRIRERDREASTAAASGCRYRGRERSDWLTRRVTSLAGGVQGGGAAVTTPRSSLWPEHLAPHCLWASDRRHSPFAISILLRHSLSATEVPWHQSTLVLVVGRVETRGVSLSSSKGRHRLGRLLPAMRHDATSTSTIAEIQPSSLANGD
mgnify:CR=1 FL=1